MSILNHFPILQIFVISLFTVSAANSAFGDEAWSAMTYNLEYDSTSLPDTLSLIEDSKIDVICFQELTFLFVGKFKEKLGVVYPYSLFEPRKGTWGVGIASRFPLTQSDKFTQQPHRMPATETIVRVNNQSVQITCIHLFPLFAKRHKNLGHLESMNENAKLRVAQA